MSLAHTVSNHRPSPSRTRPLPAKNSATVGLGIIWEPKSRPQAASGEREDVLVYMLCDGDQSFKYIVRVTKNYENINRTFKRCQGNERFFSRHALRLWSGIPTRSMPSNRVDVVVSRSPCLAGCCGQSSLPNRACSNLACGCACSRANAKSIHERR